MVVHLFGQAVDMDPVMKIAKKYNLKVTTVVRPEKGKDFSVDESLCGKFNRSSTFID
mgnify:CR=1 FL=1